MKKVSGKSNRKDDDDKEKSNDDKEEENVEIDTRANTVNNEENDIQEENVRDDNDKSESGNRVRRSVRNRVQRMTINADDIGDCDTENDPDYKD